MPSQLDKNLHGCSSPWDHGARVPSGCESPGRDEESPPEESLPDKDEDEEVEDDTAAAADDDDDDEVIVDPSVSVLDSLLLELESFPAVVDWPPAEAGGAVTLVWE